MANPGPFTKRMTLSALVITKCPLTKGKLSLLPPSPAHLLWAFGVPLGRLGKVALVGQDLLPGQKGLDGARWKSRTTAQHPEVAQVDPSLVHWQGPVTVTHFDKKPISKELISWLAYLVGLPSVLQI